MPESDQKDDSLSIIFAPLLDTSSPAVFNMANEDVI